MYLYLTHLLLLHQSLAQTTFELGDNTGKFFVSSFERQDNTLNYYANMGIGTHVTEPQ